MFLNFKWAYLALSIWINILILVMGEKESETHEISTINEITFSSSVSGGTCLKPF